MDFTLYYESEAADERFQRALVTEYGKDACNKRYLQTWEMPTHIAKLAISFQAASQAWHEHVVLDRRAA